MADINNWCAVGVVQEEPKLMKIKDDKVMARTILAVPPQRNGDETTYLPLTAYNKKAHVLCAIAHRGSTIYCKGIMRSSITLTSKQLKNLVGVTFKITDFVVLKKEPVEVNANDYVDIVELYEPEYFMEDINENGK